MQNLELAGLTDLVSAALGYVGSHPWVMAEWWAARSHPQRAFPTQVIISPVRGTSYHLQQCCLQNNLGTNLSTKVTLETSELFLLKLPTQQSERVPAWPDGFSGKGT